MRLEDFDYDLPADLVAQTPLEERDASRMLVLNRREQVWSDSSFKDFPQHLHSNDVVVVNNSRVIPARLTGHREQSGGQVEIFLVRELQEKEWEALVRPGGRLKKGSRAVFGEGKLLAEMLDDPGPELRKVRFYCEGSFDEVFNEIGSTPLPPYIKRSGGVSSDDRERYQTVYSKHRGAIAAPTAGLHFTPEVLAEIARRASLVEITLHVGYGTFEPVRVDDVTGAANVQLYSLTISTSGSTSPTPTPTPTLTSVTVSPSSASVNVGSTQQFAATARDQNARLLELQAATRLVDHHTRLGEPAPVLDRVSELCEWFPADSQLTDVVRARGLLAETISR